MKFLNNQLFVKRSLLSGSGKGLFTKKFIAKGTRITEYKGKISTWKEADHDDGRNGYIYYVSRNHVINAKGNKTAFAQFANDASGYTRQAGLKNNAAYAEENKRVFVDAIKDIPAGMEIFVSYGKEYWDVMKKNGNLK